MNDKEKESEAEKVKCIEEKRIKYEQEKLIEENCTLKKKQLILVNVHVLVQLYQKLIKQRFSVLMNAIKVIPPIDKQRQDRRKKILNAIRQRAQALLELDNQINAQRMKESQLASLNDTIQKDIPAKMESYFTELTKVKERMLNECITMQQEAMRNYMTSLFQMENQRQSQMPLAS